jgi:non-ribosomal peptide synthetase component E (peptide arylation enzyme)
MLKSEFENVKLSNLTITDYVFENIDQHLNSIAFVDGENGSTLTFKEIKHGLECFGAALIQRDFKVGDCALIYSPIISYMQQHFMVLLVLVAVLVLQIVIIVIVS